MNDLRLASRRLLKSPGFTPLAVLTLRKLTAQARASGGLPDGWAFRLPTEAQWEYACRAGTRPHWPFGVAPAV